MPRLSLSLAAMFLGVTVAHAASPYPVHIERQHGSTLVIEHTPVSRGVAVRTIHRAKIVRSRKARAARVASVGKFHRRKIMHAYRRDSALAGGCRDGGYVRRQSPTGPVVVLHRDVCEGIAPISSLPPQRFLARRITGAPRTRSSA